ncbi:type IV secretion system DNA-binding domain-containing protein [Hansschlegelia beijingensis]|uniref:type IV secretion system DNA-binding domain-containing protein n=1 Tax=Hansschlegelia beijingensis TaxID=1133344 RepID=UPI00387F021D
MTFLTPMLGSAPRRSKWPAVFAALAAAAVITTIASVLLIFWTSPFIEVDGTPRRLRLNEFWYYAFGHSQVDAGLARRLGLAALCGAAASLVAAIIAWRRTPMTDCAVTMPHDGEPRLHHGEYASRELNKRLATRYGRKSEPGLWLVPGVRLPREAETNFILIVGDKGSGKSTIMRALASQAISRRDRVLLHCVKGDVTQSFGPDEAVLIAAHHAEGWAWDAAADLKDEAAFMDLAAAVIPTSGSSAFWSQSARAVFVDILRDLVNESGHSGWTFAELADRLLTDPQIIRERIDRLDLSASPLIEAGPEGLSTTTFGVMATLWSAALNGVRPLALAWKDTPADRRFSVRRWLAGGGQRTVIIQTAPEYQELSTLVSTALLTRIINGVSDPSLKTDSRRRVTLALDEFHSLGRIPRIEDAMAVGREKGLVVIAALQNLAQLQAVYGNRSQVVQDLFGLRIFLALAAGASADLASALIGRRTLIWRERNLDPNVKSPYKYERAERFVVSPTEFQRDLGIRQIGKNAADPSHKIARAIISGLGDVYQLDWPLTIWRKKRDGFVLAKWMTRARVRAGRPDQRASPKG